MNEEQYILGRLAEECAEVGHIALKAQAFGIEFPNPIDGVVNLDKLVEELNDLNGTVDLLRELLAKRRLVMGDTSDPDATIRKQDKIRRFAKYAVQQGTLTLSPKGEGVL